MKASVITFLLCLLFVTFFVSITVAAAEVSQDNPMEGGQQYGGELARGRCIKGCCNRNFIGMCKVCCASDEEAKAFAEESRDKLGRRGGQAKVDEATTP